MDRAQWRKERRLWNEVQMDTLHARHYDQHWGHTNPSHRHTLERFLDPPDPRDAQRDVHLKRSGSRPFFGASMAFALKWNFYKTASKRAIFKLD